jgi:hypothetical protein
MHFSLELTSSKNVSLQHFYRKINFGCGPAVSSGVLLLSAFPEVPVVSCARVDPAGFVVLTAVDVPEIFAIATMLL